MVTWERLGNIFEVCEIQAENPVKYQHLPLVMGMNGSRMTTTANNVQTSLSEKKKNPLARWSLPKVAGSPMWAFSGRALVVCVGEWPRVLGSGPFFRVGKCGSVLSALEEKGWHPEKKSVLLVFEH